MRYAFGIGGSQIKFGERNVVEEKRVLRKGLSE
jgi:hypothetical protein